jgi:hypothetical protein
MNERLLQYIWQFQLFNRSELNTYDGENLTVIFPGHFNTNQGPDFSDARIKIGDAIWAGAIELHVNSTDWIRHKHDDDKNYENVILHVVWENDLKSKSRFPVLEVSGRVSRVLLDRYQYLMNADSFIPCEGSIHLVPDIVWESWKERLLAQRLSRRSNMIGQMLVEKKYHWEEVFWILLARNFGVRVNMEAFESVAQSLPLAVLARHRNQIHQLEALLFGQAGLLDNKLQEEYPRLLQREYQFLRKKYALRPIQLPLYFLRMRPRNFPTIRLAQLAMIIHGATHLFSRIKEAQSIDEIRRLFDVVANDYWHYHYRFDESSAFVIKKLGKSMIENVIINTVAPILFAYGVFHNLPEYQQKAIKWLEQTGAESNGITSGFAKLSIKTSRAFDSQALLELKNEYCEKRRCLECAAGHAILKGKTITV